MKYKVRTSSVSDLLASCGKVDNEFAWKKLDVFNDSHKKLAVEIFNKVNGFVTEETTTADTIAGIKRESEAVQMYDEYFKTNYFVDYEKSRKTPSKKGFEKENDYITGSRDFGNDIKTIDCKVSTDKNVFDIKRFVKVENDYVIQLNGYSWLYGTPEIELYNALMNPLDEQIFKKVSSRQYFYNLSDEENDAYTEKLENNYDYTFLPLKNRIIIKEVPLIKDFQEIVKHRVELLNKWIINNLE